MSRLKNRLAGLAGCLAILLIVCGIPLVLLGIDAVPSVGDFTWDRLTAPDDGTLALVLISAVAWVAWAVIVVSLIAEALARMRGVRSVRIPGLAGPQLAAGRLVAVAALLFVTTPIASQVMNVPPAAAVPGPPAGVAAPPAHAVRTAHPTARQDEPTDRAATVRYTVKRGDSLWNIAQEHLGDGTRFREIVALNQAALNGQPDFIAPGLVLHVPDERPLKQADAYVVQPGDTLSAIAEEELGEARSYPEIFEASRRIVQPDGRQLEDPDLILPGWRLTLPSHAGSTEPPHPKNNDPSQKNSEPSPRPTQTTQTGPPELVDEPETESQGAGEDVDSTATPSWLLPGLAGAGSIFGGALWLVLRAQRRTQLRHRRPGTIIASPPAELLSAEKTAHATASVIAPRIDTLDTALRSLPTLPHVLTVTLTSDEISLTLHEAADLPTPWTGAGTGWRITLADVPDPPEDSFPPYPLLVSVGQAADGSFVFLNLEGLRTLTVTGDSNQKVAFARHLAAELAVNPWSIVTTVDVLGLGSDLASFNLGRVRTHPVGDTGFIAALARLLSSINEPQEPDDFHAAIIATANRPSLDLDELAAVIEGVPGRSSAALIDLEGEPRSSGTHLHLTADGRLQATSLAVDVTAAGLSEDEARACALLLDLTLDETVVPIPTPRDHTAVSDFAGALTERLTEPRPNGPTGEQSLLPLDALVYADAAATTVQDVELLAPRATPEAHIAVDATDPSLDEDLARWESPALTTTKLTLLGPVGARTTGDTKATAHRRPFYVELLAYLALHPDGVSAPNVADAFGIRPERVRVDMSQLRRWLGSSPSTGDVYLPNAHPGRAADSPALYSLNGVLCDLDLFRRLRTRGQSRGAEGIEDLIAALRLVSGEPFTDLRKDHWSWLLEGNRWDHIMSCAIVDVAHIVTTHALASGDHDLGFWAAQVACTAAPYDEVAQLDMVQAEKSAGDDEKADQDLNDKVFNRRDDGLPPINLPQRTAQIVDDKNWAIRGPRPRRTG